MKLVQSMGVFFLLTILIVFTGCSIDDVTLESITVSNADTDDSIGVGDTEQFTATGNYSDGSTKDLTSSVTWTSTGTDSDNNPIASITNPGGLATALTGGTATITATYIIDSNTHSDSETLTVISSSGSVSIVAGATNLCTGAYDLDTTTVALDATTGTATVTWTNNDTVPHTVISTDDASTTCTPSGGTTTGSPLNSGTILASQTFTATFTATGEYNYVCTQLGHQMRGKVIVQ